LAIGYWLFASYWLLSIGYWLLAIVYWLLAIGYWLFAPLPVRMPLQTHRSLRAAFS
jgi:hypothetical protein